METKQVTVSISKNKKLREVIMTFFVKNEKSGLFRCKTCQSSSRGYMFLLKQHLKVQHPKLWSRYLIDIGNNMKNHSTPPKYRKEEVFLATKVTIKSENGADISLEMPESRMNRDGALKKDLKVVEKLSGFKGRIQEEYNKDPIGPYMGPFDQPKKTPLKLQLRNSNLNYSTFTEFQHEPHIDCQTFDIKSSYANISELKKIESLKIKQDTNRDDEPKKDTKRILYTCTKNNGCVIPCLCKDCCMNNPQCELHKIKHEELFNYETDAMTIRSSEIVCKDSSFLSHSYTIRYANIPLHCNQCSNDLLHHNMYHLKLHSTCKFCLQIEHKVKSNTARGFKMEVKSQKQYLDRICPHCDKDFSDSNKKQKHVHYAHGGGRIKCTSCTQTFSSKQALDYHKSVSHEKVVPLKCDECSASFTTKVSLADHRKFLHSAVSKITCMFCKKEFKRQKDANFHYTNMHQIDRKDHYKNNWNALKERERFQCSICDCHYKYKKDLNKHQEINHNQETNKSSLESAGKFKCDLCDRVYKNQKSVYEHVRIFMRKTHTIVKCVVKCSSRGTIA